MAICTQSFNDIELDSFFQSRITDNNNVSVTDINAGLVNLFSYFNEREANMTETQRYMVRDFEEGYPDLVSRNSILSDQVYWWWILLANRLENPMTEIKPNCIYSILSRTDINDFINKSNENIDSQRNDRIGSIVELN